MTYALSPYEKDAGCAIAALWDLRSLCWYPTRKLAADAHRSGIDLDALAWRIDAVIKQIII